MIFSLFKYIHLLAVSAGVGATLSQLYLAKQNTATGDNGSTTTALGIARNVEFPAFLVAFIFGLAMAMVNPEYFKLGYIHVKILLAVLLIGVTHMQIATLRRMAAAEGDASVPAPLQKRRTRIVATGLVLILAIFFLIIFKPF